MRATLGLLALALGLGLWVWWFEIRGEERRAEQETAGKRLVELERDEIAALRLALEGGGQAELRRAEGEDWQVVEPVEYPADAVAVRRALDTLPKLLSEQKLDAPADLGPFELGADAPRVAVVPREGETITLELGGRTPVGARRYLRVESDPDTIHTVDYAATTALEPKLDHLRDRRLTRLGRDDVRALEVHVGGERVVRLERDADAQTNDDVRPPWRIVEPVADRADVTRVDRLIEDLDLARVNAFVDQPDDPSTYGLAAPEVELYLTSAEDRTLRLALGRSDDDKAWARLDDRGPVFEVPVRTVQGIPRELFEYRHKRLLELDEPDVARLVLSFPREDARWSFRQEDGRWQPEDEGIRVDTLELGDLLYALSGLDAIALLPPDTTPADVGLEPARVRITARDAADAELGWLELGDPDPAAGLAARSSADAERLWRVENRLGEDVPLSVDAFRSRFAGDDPNVADEADAIEAP